LVSFRQNQNLDKAFETTLGHIREAVSAFRVAERNLVASIGSDPGVREWTQIRELINQLKAMCIGWLEWQ
jgi:hypothetical protein